jgi:hypothetical protein
MIIRIYAKCLHVRVIVIQAIMYFVQGHACMRVARLAHLCLYLYLSQQLKYTRGDFTRQDDVHRYARQNKTLFHYLARFCILLFPLNATSRGPIPTLVDKMPPGK